MTAKDILAERIVPLVDEAASRDDQSATGVEIVDRADYVPMAQEATADLPQAYAEGCIADWDQTAPEPCIVGEPDGALRVVLAGDGKALQWSDALDAIAVEQGWRLELATKSGCAFAEALRVDSEGQDYTACPEYSRNLLAELVADPPDAVIVSQRHDDAFDASGEWARDAMVEPLARTWETLEARGVDVIVLLDNPTPRGLPVGDGNVYRCVAEFPDELSSCAFDRELGVEGSGIPAQLAAAGLVPEVDVVDMADTLCDDTTCPPVINDVLVYRQGSHITNTYAMTAKDILAERIVPLVDEAASRD
jgi:hypothetical protein